MAHVMIVDDDPTTRSFLRDVLVKLFGHRVTVASSIEQGLEHVRGSCPDLILLDRHLPDGTALEFCRRLSEFQAASEVPKWLITGEKPLSWDAGFWRRFNVQGVLVKPFRIDLIDHIVHQCLQESAV